MSQKNMLMAAALGASEAGTSTFTAEELTVGAWVRNHETFGLRGFEDRYPDHHKVYTHLCGKKGLVAEGLLAKDGHRYYLTAAGRHVADKLGEES